MTTNDPFAARYDESALASQRQTTLDALAAGTPEGDTLYLFADEGAFWRPWSLCGALPGADR